MKREAGTVSLLWPIVVKRVGWRRGYKVMLHCACWWIGEAERGEPFASNDEYIAHWSLPRATGFRDQASFREAFPTCETPRELAEKIGFKIEGKADKTTTAARLIAWHAVPGL